MLPPEERQRWLLVELRKIFAQRGAAPWLAHPILLPTDRDFPDRFRADVPSCKALLLRLLRAAKLERLGVDVTTFQERIDPTALVDAGLPTTAHRGTAATFAGIDAGGRARFTIDETLIPDGVSVVGAFAHEVAHAYRRFHRIETDDVALEEERTDLTTVFLGFGVLTANAAYQYVTEHRETLGGVVRRTRHQELGYLRDPELAFVLGVQVALRAQPGELRQVAAHLATNQRALFEQSVKVARRRRAWVLEALDLTEHDVMLYVGPGPAPVGFFARLRAALRRLAPRKGIELDAEVEARAALARALGGDVPRGDA